MLNLADLHARADQKAPLSPAEQYVISQLGAGQKADLSQFCRQSDPTSPEKPDPRRDDDRREWKSSCRQLSANFLARLLTENEEAGTPPHMDIIIGGARIDGPLILDNAVIDNAFEVYDSWFQGGIRLRFAEVKKVIQLGGSRIVGPLEATGIQTKSDFDITNVRIDNQSDEPIFRDGTTLLLLNRARIGGDVRMAGDTIYGAIDAEDLISGGGLLFERTDESPTDLGKFNIHHANIAGQLDGAGAHVHGALNLDSARVGGSILFGPQTESNGSNSPGYFDGPISMQFANISGLLDLSRSTFAQSVTATTSAIRGKVFLDDARFAQILSLSLTRVGGDLEASGTTFSSFDLSWAQIEGTLKLGDARSEKDVLWPDHKKACEQRKEAREQGKPVNLTDVGGLDLRNAHVAGLVDTRKAWPPKCELFLDGFSFDHLGGRTGDTAFEMSNRGRWWDTDWAQLDVDFTPAPYLQLATAFTNAGNRDAANEIRYAEKVRELHTLGGGSWLLATTLRVVAGFGIGVYSFFALGWALFISLLGASYLRLCQKDLPDSDVFKKQRFRFGWCFGASLSRLLPFIEINKEFADFFNDPKRERLFEGQVIFFNIVALMGYILGIIVAGAVTGLLQGA